MVTTINKKQSPEIIKTLTRGTFLSSNHTVKSYRDYFREVKDKVEEYREVLEILGYNLIERERYIYCHPQNFLEKAKADKIEHNKQLLKMYAIIKEYNNETTVGKSIFKARLEDFANNNDGVMYILSSLKGDLIGKKNSEKIDYVLQELQKSRFIELRDEERQEYIILDAWDFIESLKSATKIIKQAYLNK